jgi:hypothetical protein
LWIVGSALFVLALAFVSYSEIKKQFDETALMRRMEDDPLLVPQLCGDARGVAGTDYSIENSTPLRENGKPNVFATCWYEIPKFRPLYPEYKDVSDKELLRKLYADHGVPIRDPANPWKTLGAWASIAFGIPLAVLVLGASLVWAFSGFSAKQP